MLFRPFSTSLTATTALLVLENDGKGGLVALGGFWARPGKGPRVAFFAHFTYKKKPSGDLFQTFYIDSRKKSQIKGDEYIRGGQSGLERKARIRQPIGSTGRSPYEHSRGTLQFVNRSAGQRPHSQPVLFADSSAARAMFRHTAPLLQTFRYRPPPRKGLSFK